MVDVQAILAAYAQLRDNGMDATAALKELRDSLAPLDGQQKKVLAKYLRAWESGEIQAPAASQAAAPLRSGREAAPAEQPAPASQKPSPIRPISPPKKSVIRPIAANGARIAAPDLDEEDTVSWITCPNCGKDNGKSEAYCYACGYLLPAGKGQVETRHLGMEENALFSGEYFGPDSVLLLQVRGAGEAIELRPQKFNHELVIGRTTSGSAMMPDVDLTEYQAAQLGISRLHLSLGYKADLKTLHVADLDSANGTFLNGQRLLPQEIRVLRDGDELRLGRLELKVEFRHASL